MSALGVPDAGGAYTVQVAGSRPYPVRIGAGVQQEAPRHLTARQVAVIADATALDLHGDTLLGALRAAGIDVTVLRVAPGERSKDLAHYGALLGELAQAKLGRDGAVIAFGGGVTCDLAGFVAATWLRGVELLQVPTTLLAMADAAIGGKTAVNLPAGKNLVGVFWPPAAVLMDVRTLATLPEPVLHEGLTEVLKHGLLADAALVTAVADGTLGTSASDATWARAVAASARVKARIVSSDEREAATGARAHLNLGHTLAHALEGVHQGRLPHGAAVAWGLLYSAHLSLAHARASGRDADDWSEPVRSLLRATSFRAPDPVAWDDLRPFLDRDKKILGGRRRWVLMDRPIASYLADDVTDASEHAAWNAFVRDVAHLRPGVATPQPLQ